jgi:hypothetical protein
MLHPAFFEDATLPMFVLVTKLSVSAVGHDLNIAMWMKGPDSTKGEGVIIENTQGTEVCIFRIVVLVEGKVPAAVKCSILEGTVGLINAFRLTNNDIIFHHPFPYLSVPKSLLRKKIVFFNHPLWVLILPERYQEPFSQIALRLSKKSLPQLSLLSTPYASRQSQRLAQPLRCIDDSP